MNANAVRVAAISDQAWQGLREASADMQRIVESGFETDRDLDIAKMAMLCVLSDLSLMESGLNRQWVQQ